MSNLPSKQEKIEITDSVLAKVSKFQELGQLHLPSNYSAPNALKAAWIHLQDVQDKDKNKALDVCSRESIAMSLFQMVTEGLSVAKKQCYFIVYGKELQYQRSYFGNVANARRMAGVKGVTGHVIYEGDKEHFKYEVDVKTGRKRIIEHKTSLDSIDNNKIAGAYAIVDYGDDIYDVEVMTIKQIRQAWMQGKANGVSPAHKNFPDQMAIRTVINRALKIALSSSDDSYLNIDEPDNTSNVGDNEKEVKEVYFDQAEEVADNEEQGETEASKEDIKADPQTQTKKIPGF